MKERLNRDMPVPVTQMESEMGARGNEDCIVVLGNVINDPHMCAQDTRSDPRCSGPP